MDKIVFKELMAAAGVPQVALRRRCDARRARRRWAWPRSACRAGSSRRASAPRWASCASARPARSAPRSTSRSPTTRASSSRRAPPGWRSSARSSARRDAPEASVPGEIVLGGPRRLVRLRGEVHARAAWSSSSPPASPRPRPSASASWRCRAFTLRRLQRPGAGGLLRRRRGRAAQRAQHDARARRARAPTAALWAASGRALPRGRRPALRDRRRAPRRPARPRVLSARAGDGQLPLRWSRRDLGDRRVAVRPGGSFWIQTRK